MKRMFLVFLILSSVLFSVFAEDIENVKFKRVYDGDTFFVDIDGVPDVFGEGVGVRLRGVDTPEIRGDCPTEKALAYQAKEYVAAVLESAERIDLLNVTRGKYFRIVASVVVDEKIHISEELIRKRLGVRYYGGKKTKSWCNGGSG